MSSDNIAEVINITGCTREEAIRLLELCQDPGFAITQYFEKLENEAISNKKVEIKKEAIPKPPPVVDIPKPRPVEIKKEEGKKPIQEEEKKAPSIRPIISPKPYTKYITNTAKLTNWIEVPIKELLDFCFYEIKYEKVNPKDYVCPICQMDYYDGMFDLSETEVKRQNEEMISGKTEIRVVQLDKCHNHFYHKVCAEHLGKAKDKTEFLKCAVCNHIYGTLMGDMPNGKMKFAKYPAGQMPCAGYEKHGTIVINYSIGGGSIKGKHFTGTARTAYLPDNKEGNEILKLLQIAFDRKLTFTVGTSVTTGATNVVVWNGIHHKTNLGGGPEYYGYPDPTYFKRVKEELAAKGVTQ